MKTYNALLYTERMNRGLSGRKMAKFLEMSTFTYSMIKMGHFKPSRKQIECISIVLEVNYKEYLKGETSYPAELPEKNKNRIVAFFYNLPTTLTYSSKKSPTSIL